MNRFGYWRDPLFLTAVAAYAVNRWLLKPIVAVEFLHDHFDDLLLIPAALPLVLWVQRRLGLRQQDGPPTGAEVLFHFAIWSFICECVGPLWLGRGTSDLWDVVVYGLGGLTAWLCWNHSKTLATSRK